MGKRELAEIEVSPTGSVTLVDDGDDGWADDDDDDDDDGDDESTDVKDPYNDHYYQQVTLDRTIP